MNNDHFDLQSLLSSKAAALVSWVAAAMGLGTVAGIVNIFVGVLSACWLAAQLWNYYRFTLPANLAAERERLERESTL